MLTSRRDRWSGLIILFVAMFWCWGVVESIPALEDSSRLGARGFPLGLGVLLALLGLAIFALSLRAQPGDGPAAGTGGDQVPLGMEVWAVTITVGLLAAYAALLEYTGFIIATALCVALALGPVLNVWRPMLIIGMSLGMSLGIYLVFGKLLGVYLPYGRWINLAF